MTWEWKEMKSFFYDLEPNNPTWTIIFSIVGSVAALALIVFGISMFVCIKSNQN